MKATNILYEEHRIIIKVLECLQKILDSANESGKLDALAARNAIDFFRNFADGCHHAKEEDRLFVAMQENGIPREGGPIGVMLMEHDLGRKYVRAMSNSVELAAQGDRQALGQFTQNAIDLKDLLQSHIDKEDQVLFPMADQILVPEAADALLSDFKKIEEHAGGSRHTHYLSLAKELCERYGIAFIEDEQIRTIRQEFHLN
ncbi:MAG: hemerythrin domain-containing protein [bacterium]